MTNRQKYQRALKLCESIEKAHANLEQLLQDLPGDEALETAEQSLANYDIYVHNVQDLGEAKKWLANAVHSETKRPR